MELIHITKEHTGKMQGMQSISTSVMQNKHCQARIKNGDTICNKCYSARMMKMYKNMDKCFSDISSY